MDFVAVVDQVIALLHQRGRVTYRTLQQQFQLEEATLEDVKEELLYGQRVAADEDGKVLVWTGTPGTAPAAVSLPVAPSPQAPLAYTPPYLAEKILTSPSALAGERKQITVLFADLKSSMELLADRDPEEARQLLDPVLERMMAAVHRYEGTVNQVMGDGIMALFGAPIAYEDHAMRACYAALAMQEAIRRYSTEVRRVHGLEVQIRVGLNSGIAGFLSAHFRNRGAYDQSIAAAQRALTLATADQDVVLQALVNQNLGAAYWAQGDYLRAIDCLGQTAMALSGAQRHERFGQAMLPSVQSRAFFAACHAELGRFAESSVLGEEGLQIAETIAHPSSLMWAYYGVGLLALCQGDLRRALPWLERAMGICQEANLPIFFPRMAAALGAAYTLAGHLADAIPLLTQAIEQTTAVDMVGFRALCRLPLGEAHLLAGRLEEAHTLAEQTLALACEHQEHGNQAHALRLLGDIAARREPSEIEPAEAFYQQALALAKELGMRPLVAHCHLGLGTLYRQIGRLAEAHAALSTAIDLYRTMEMSLWLHQAEAALGSLHQSQPDQELSRS